MIATFGDGTKVIECDSIHWSQAVGTEPTKLFGAGDPLLPSQGRVAASQESATPLVLGHNRLSVPLAIAAAPGVRGLWALLAPLAL